LDNDPCPIAAFARSIALLSRLLVYLLPSSRAVRAYVITGPWCAGLWIIIGGVAPTRILRLHGQPPTSKVIT